MNDIFKILKDNNCQLRILYLAKLSFRYEGETKAFSNKQKLKGFTTTRPALTEVLEGTLQVKKRKDESMQNSI